MKTGNTQPPPGIFSSDEGQPQWSPVMKTGNTPEGAKDYVRIKLPQWSPVMKTGNTRTSEMSMVASI